jgi:hypothetical protein
MIALRHRAWKRAGAGLAGLAIAFQLMLSTLGPTIAAGPAEPIDALAGHALCLSGQPARQPAVPTHDSPAPARDHFAFCCLWHQLPGVEPLAAQPVQPAVYASLSEAPHFRQSFIPSHRRGPLRARAPPSLA